MLVSDYQTPDRMALKRRAVPLPDVRGKRVLDVGCDAGEWCWLAADGGAVHVLGLDRNREVKGRGWVDLIERNRDVARVTSASACKFEPINIGKQWRVFGRFDVILALSVYHHIYENCGDHRAVWFWLWLHCTQTGEVLWEGPVDDSDPVVRANVCDAHRPGYTESAILTAASWFFAAEYLGPALHEPTRKVFRFRPHTPNWRAYGGAMCDGAGGASKAFMFADGRRMDEIEHVLGWRPFPGSLNVMLDSPFGWNHGYFRAQILDVKDRSKGINSEWAPRWARFYPVRVNGEDADVFRFEGETYAPEFVELIAPWRIRDDVGGPRVLISRC